MTEKVHYFALADRAVPLNVRVNPRARRLSLRIDAGGRGLRVSVPYGTSEKQISDFLTRFRGWIEKKLEKFPLSLMDKPMLRAGVKIPYLGEPHLIVHRPGRGVTRLNEESSTGEKQIIVAGEVAYLPRRLRDFFIIQARATIRPLAFTYAAHLDRQPHKIDYKDTKSRWGSCSSTGNLSFSWRIMMAPLGVVHYLVAHEVAHLVEMNHGAGFWQICTSLCPQTPQARAWLRRNGQTLHAIEFA